MIFQIPSKMLTSIPGYSEPDYKTVVILFCEFLLRFTIIHFNLGYLFGEIVHNSSYLCPVRNANLWKKYNVKIHCKNTLVVIFHSNRGYARNSSGYEDVMQLIIGMCIMVEAKNHRIKLQNSICCWNFSSESALGCNYSIQLLLLYFFPS